ncbi:MAG: hypothetical protein WBF99_12515 [Xanthobacteraceae bacterium]
MASIKDRMIYVVIVAHSGGDFLPEQNVSELGRKTVVSNIASDQYSDVVQVLECNPAEHLCNDVTAEVMREAAFSILESKNYDDLNDWQREFVDDHAPGALIAHRDECRAEAAYRRELMPGRAGWGL